MLVTRSGLRTAAPAFFDMACRFGHTALPAERRGGFRIGDRCAAYAFLSSWRHVHPTRRLTVVEDRFLPNNEESGALTPRLLFGSVADVLVEAEAPHEVLPAPEGEPLFSGCIWNEWSAVYDRRYVVPPLVWPHDADLPERGSYVTVHPLIDAAYDVDRNRPAAWWQALIERLQQRVPVVVLERTRPLAETFALITHARAHIGGETGLTLWAPVQRTPTLALYHDTARYPAGRWWHRPITFGAPVEIHLYPPEGKAAAAMATRFLKTIESAQEAST